MPARGKISLDGTQYEKKLEELKSKTGKATNDMSKSVKDFSKGVGDAGKALGTVAGDIGSKFGALGKTIGALASGPVALFTAAIGAMVAMGVKLWDTLTTSEEEYRDELDRIAKKQEKQAEQIRKDNDEAVQYLQRLKELAGNENLSNSEKTEAIKLIQTLNDRYDDLGIKIGVTTGKIYGLIEAEKKLNEENKQKVVDSLKRQIENLMKISTAAGMQQIQGGNDTLESIMAWFVNNNPLDFGEDSILERYAKNYKAANASDRLEFVNNILDSGTLKTSEARKAWSEEAERLEKIVELQERLNSLQETGHETRKSQLATLRAEAEKERNILTDLEDFFSGVEEEEKKLAEAEKKRLEDEEAAVLKLQQAQYDAWQKEQQRLAEQEKKWKQYQTDAALNLKGDALRASGHGKEADIADALRKAEAAKGSALTDDEYSRIVDMTTAKYDLNAALKRGGASNLDLAPRVNSLIARGGSEAPVKMPKVEDLQSRTLTSVDKIQQITNRILSSIDDWTTV